MTASRRVCLLVPEYRTQMSPGGGVATVADFLAETIEQARPHWKLTIVSPRMHHSAPENRRLLNPGTWLRGPQTIEASVNGRSVTYVGANFAEFEWSRFRPRAVLNRLLEPVDAIVAIAGSPATFNMVRDVGTPTLGQVATTVAEERSRANQAGPFLRRTLARINTLLTSRLDLRGIRVPSIVFVENYVMQAWCLDNTPASVRLVPPGVDIEAFRPASFSEPFEYPYVLTVGRLDDPRKDPATLVRAFACALSLCPDLPHHLVMAGNRPPAPEVLALASGLGIADRVHVATKVSREHLISLYQGADLFAMSSTEEGLGLVQVEALACGLPVLTTRTAGASFILDGTSAGVLVDLGSDTFKRMGSQMADLLASPERRKEMSQAAAAVAERFSARTVGKSFIEAVESAFVA